MAFPLKTLMNSLGQTCLPISMTNYANKKKVTYLIVIFLITILHKNIMQNMNKLTSTKLLSIKNISLKISTLTFKMSWPSIRNFLMALLFFFHKKVHIDILPGLVPLHHVVYLVPRAYKQMFKKEFTSHGWYWYSRGMCYVRMGLTMFHYI